jgi:tRNA uridine 5-carboxymethylaminomethyl modification enzyme
VLTRRFRVIVIGGGHAGVEAAWAAANLLPEKDFGRASVALVTLDASKIGVMSCNPAIGGLAKGQLVREVDAMGGLMGLAADATGIHFKVLNTSKGPAVRGPRCQNDKHAYAEAVQELIASRPEIEVVEGSVETLKVVRTAASGARTAGACVRTNDRDLTLEADAVVLTTGTFMRGLMHTGEAKTPGGRHGEGAASVISASLRELGFELGRLKTGTPPRLRRGSIAWEDLPEQLGDRKPVAFSALSGTRQAADGTRQTGVFSVIERFPLLDQVDCRQTHTTAEGHAAIRANLHRAPMFSGQIESAGPRYCPSIEDKVVRFADRESHGVFLEPESLRTDWVYCNGISSSLPADVQEVVVRSMPGCERAEILRHGYAVEYDMVRPHQIRATGETKLVSGLFLAGQINGTSGYEEAAAQGLIAGVNAGRMARSEPADFVLGRDQAYIGVLMDDLVTKTPVEPYRMFTSRAEHRLLLRADNAAERLTPVARDIGLLEGTALGAGRLALFDERSSELARIREAIERGKVEGEPASKFARRVGVEAGDVARALPGVRASASAWFTAWADLRYEAYVVRQRAEIRRTAELERRRLPDELDYHGIEGLRAEAKQALARFQPETFGQAGRLEGVTPADVMLLAVHAKRRG